jgi:hypothetical protein
MKGTTEDRLIFILGCERSGSTWLLNILDAHPSTLFFMEPFADYLAIFPEFPHRNFYLERSYEELEEIVRRKLNSLERLKYPFLYRPGRPTCLLTLEKACLRGWRRMRTRPFAEEPLFLQRYNSLSLNTHRTNSGLAVRKQFTERRVTGIKELRINFKIPFFARLYPSAKYLVTIREPGAQICSIVERMQRGSLGELRRSLLTLKYHLRANERFAKYWDVAAGWETLDIKHQLALWWLINYEVLIGDLRAYGLDFQIVGNEDLSESPRERAADIFRFCDLEMTETVSDYITRSTQLQEAQAVGTLDTHRISREYYKHRIAAVDTDTRSAINNVFMKLDPDKAIVECVHTPG